MSKRAVILAGGKGTRLKPFTITLPKPLMPIGDIPILEIIIRQLKKNGFNHVTITLNHMAEIIKAFFGNGEKWDIYIDYTLENIPLSTMGPLTLIQDLPSDFLVMNGDVLTDLDFGLFFENHTKYGNKFTISAFEREHTIDYGILNCDQDGRLLKFQEKPTDTFLVSMGIYMLNQEILKIIPRNTFFGFDHLMNLLLEGGQTVNVEKYNGLWLDIGRPDDYERAFSMIKNIVF